MKLHLEIESESEFESTIYRPGDTVKGTLVVRGCALKKLVQIKATFQGKKNVQVPPEVNGSCPNQLMHTIYKRSKLLETQQLSHSNSPSDSCIHFCSFEFEIPTRVNCTCSDGCQLPPSLRAENNKLGVSIRYCIVVKVQRQVFQAISRTTTAKREIRLATCPAVTARPVSCISWLPASSLNKDSSNSLEDWIRHLRCDSLPPYSPALQMQLILPQPPVLVRGCGTRVRIVMHTPTDMVAGGNIYIRSVMMRLMQKIATSFFHMRHDVINPVQNCAIYGAVPINTSEFELGLGNWGNFIVVRQDCKPTFSSCMLEITYSFEVTAGISNGLDGPIQYVRTALDVLVMDPPPSYENSSAARSLMPD